MSDAPLQSAHWLNVTLHSIGDGVIVTDTKRRIVFMNPVAESLTGWKSEDAIGAELGRVFNIVNADTRQVESPVPQAFRDGKIAGLVGQRLLIDKHGVERPIDNSAAPVRAESGDVAGVVLVFRDTSEQKHNEEALRGALDYADSIISTLRHPFLVLDGNLRVVTANRAFCETFGVTPEETQGRFVYDLGDQQWAVPGLRQLLEEVLPQDHAFDDFAVEHEFPTIGLKSMLLNARRIRKPGIHSNLMLLAIEDITERRRAEAAIDNSELRYRRLFEAAQDAILILDARTGKITDANPYIQQLLGYSHDELIDKELWQIGMFEDKEAIRSAFRELQENGYIRFDNLPLVTKSGQKAEVEFVSNVYAVDHAPVIQCNIRDTTERTRLRKQTEHQAAELSDLHRRKDEFLAMLSHELRSPLAPIVNAVQLLRLGQGTESVIARQARTIIERQVGQLKHLVDDLLEVSRIATGRIKLRLEQVALAGIAEHAIETTRPLIEQRRHDLTVSLPERIVWVYGDADRLEQVVVNLLTNAAKYTDEGGHIWLNVEQEGDVAILRVRDTGVGIAADLLPRIFDLFTQAERSLDRSQGGLGIGLALVQRLVDLHSGTVQVRSVLGEGSEFVVRLPVMLTFASQSQATHAEAAQPTTSLKVLVVDDDVDTTQSLALLLKASGHDVRIAHDGPTALQAALDYRPDLLLMDVGLPGFSGLEVAKRIRQQPALEGVVMVAMSGYGQESDLQRSREAGFDRHLIKPADYGALEQILATVSRLT